MCTRFSSGAKARWTRSSNRRASAVLDADISARSGCTNRRDSLGWGNAPDELLPDVPGIQWSWEEVHPTAWLEFATAVRIWLDYLRYFEPTYVSTPRLRTRAAERVPALLRLVSDSWLHAAAGRRAVAAVLRTIERALPRQRALDELVGEHRPDIVMLTPLLHLGSPQIELLRSARALGVKTALCVGSWDHLSSKSLIREIPDRVFVWNETQKRETVELHRVPAERVHVTGAQYYDHWFGRTPDRTREQFCAMMKLPADRPFLLWVCSALFPDSPSEARFVRRWIEELRTSPDPLLSTAGVLIRPHPARLDEWHDVSLSDLPGVALHGSMPVDAEAKAGYFESLYFSGAVAGLNTSAFLEAAIVGRPVHTIILPEFSENQEGTLHFPYLLSVGGASFASRATSTSTDCSWRTRCASPPGQMATPASSRSSSGPRGSISRRPTCLPPRSRASAEHRRLPRPWRRCGRPQCDSHSGRSRWPHIWWWRVADSPAIAPFANCGGHAGRSSIGAIMRWPTAAAPLSGKRRARTRRVGRRRSARRNCASGESGLRRPTGRSAIGGWRRSAQNCSVPA